MSILDNRSGSSDVGHPQECRIRTKAYIQQQLRQPTPGRYVIL